MSDSKGMPYDAVALLDFAVLHPNTHSFFSGTDKPCHVQCRQHEERDCKLSNHNKSMKLFHTQREDKTENHTRLVQLAMLLVSPASSG